MDVEGTGWEGVSSIRQTLDPINLVGFCEHGDAPSSATNWKEFLRQLRRYQLLSGNAVRSTELVAHLLPMYAIRTAHRYLIYVVLVFYGYESRDIDPYRTILYSLHITICDNHLINTGQTLLLQ